MLGRLMPREGKFFDLFNAHAARIVEGSHELAAMLGTFSELDAHAQRIDAAERAADKITHETITLLHKTFITPFDREQIHALITTMDDILDLIQDVAESVALYDLRSVTPEAKQLAEICQMTCDRVKTTVGLLTDVKRADAILKEAGKFAAGVLSPLNVVGYREGSRVKDGEVTTPPGWKDAYRQFVDGGWNALS